MVCIDKYNLGFPIGTLEHLLNFVKLVSLFIVKRNTKKNGVLNLSCIYKINIEGEMSAALDKLMGKTKGKITNSIKIKQRLRRCDKKKTKKTRQTLLQMGLVKSMIKKYTKYEEQEEMKCIVLLTIHNALTRLTKPIPIRRVLNRFKCIVNWFALSKF